MRTVGSVVASSAEQSEFQIARPSGFERSFVRWYCLLGNEKRPGKRTGAFLLCGFRASVVLGCYGPFDDRHMPV